MKNVDFWELSIHCGWVEIKTISEFVFRAKKYMEMSGRKHFLWNFKILTQNDRGVLIGALFWFFSFPCNRSKKWFWNSAKYAILHIFPVEHDRHLDLTDILSESGVFTIWSISKVANFRKMNTRNFHLFFSSNKASFNVLFPLVTDLSLVLLSTWYFTWNLEAFFFFFCNYHIILFFVSYVKEPASDYVA